MTSTQPLLCVLLLPQLLNFWSKKKNLSSYFSVLSVYLLSIRMMMMMMLADHVLTFPFGKKTLTAICVDVIFAFFIHWLGNMQSATLF